MEAKIGTISPDRSGPRVGRYSPQEVEREVSASALQLELPSGASGTGTTSCPSPPPCLSPVRSGRRPSSYEATMRRVRSPKRSDSLAAFAATLAAVTSTSAAASNPQGVDEDAAAATRALARAARASRQCSSKACEGGGAGGGADGGAGGGVGGGGAGGNLEVEVGEGEEGEASRGGVCCQVYTTGVETSAGLRGASWGAVRDPVKPPSSPTFRRVRTPGKCSRRDSDDSFEHTLMKLQISQTAQPMDKERVREDVKKLEERIRKVNRGLVDPHSRWMP